MHHAAACDDAERKRCESAALADEQAEDAQAEDTDARSRHLQLKRR